MLCTNYKKSKYTKIISKKEGILLYNTYIGYKSLCRVSKKKRNYFLKAFEKKEFTDDIQKILIEKGHLVSIEEEEDTKLKDLYYKTVKSNTLSLTILPTEKCNFACTYCYEAFENGTMQEKTILSIIEFVEEQMKVRDRLYVSWFGGEPMLAMDIIEKLSQEFIKICNRYKKIYIASITTNGYLLTYENFKRLYSFRIINYQVSIDGNENTHNLYRALKNGNKTYETIINNLLSIRDNMKSGIFKVILRTNCSVEIMKNIREYLIFIERNFGQDKRFCILFRPVMDWGGETISSISDKLLNIEEFSNIYSILEEYNLNLEIYKDLLTPGVHLCYAGKDNQYTINSIGNIFKCTCNLDQKNAIGSISNKNIKDKSTYKMWISDLRYKTKKCDDCFFSPLCLYDWCPNNRIYKKENYLCPIDFYSFEKLILLLASKDNIDLIM